MPFDDIRNERIRKLQFFKEQGIDAYPAETKRTYTAIEAVKKFSALVKEKKSASIAGRVMAKREHGASLFFDVEDGGGKIQAYAKKNVLGAEFDLFMETVDIGDFVEAEGALFETKKGEKTIEVSRWAMLAKSLRPLPEKWHGLQDVEERFRRRYLDLLINEGVRARFVTRSEIIKTLREAHEQEGFLEVETPMLHPIPGGALARPFATRHNALAIDLYLRVAPELYLKRLLVGGFEKVYEVGKSFRNEGIDPEHNPEFTSLESYAAYWDEEKMMAFVERIFGRLAKKFGRKNKLTFAGKEIDLKKPFSRISFKDLLGRYALITNYEGETAQSLAMRARQLGIETKSDAALSKGKIADEIYKKVCRPYVLQPTFVMNHPIDISPLAKKRKENQNEVRRFQLIVAGMEIMNAFAELNDPLDQRERFREQERELRGGDEEAHRIDEEYIEAMEYGMPPAAGLGIGVDRLIMLFTDTKNIREVVLFPTLRPR